MSPLSAERLTIGHGARVLARDLALTLQAGAVTCLIGPNGAGKTTLFRTLLGLAPALGGVVRVAGAPLSRFSRAELARAVAYVPQAAPSELSTTLLDLALMGRTAHMGLFATPSHADRAAAQGALDALGIAHLSGRDMTEVSGGERQLALIARALAQEAGVIVMDEPTASLDLGNRIRVLDMIRAVAGHGVAVLVSTHEPEHAFAIADAVAVLDRDGGFATGPVAETLTAPALTRLYGVTLAVEATPSGARVVTRVPTTR